MGAGPQMSCNNYRPLFTRQEHAGSAVGDVVGEDFLFNLAYITDFLFTLAYMTGKTVKLARISP